MILLIIGLILISILLYIYIKEFLKLRTIFNFIPILTVLIHLVWLVKIFIEGG